MSCVIRDHHCCNWPQYKTFASFPPGWLEYNIYFFASDYSHKKGERIDSPTHFIFSSRKINVFWRAPCSSSQSAVNTYVHTIITFLVTASSMKPAELIKVVFFCYFLPPGLLHNSDETTLWWSGRLFRNRGRVPKLILLMIFLCNWNTRAHVCIYFKIMRCPGAYDQKV